jgi:hypothetical protein
MAIDKSTWNKKVKVSQSTIDDIKRLGMSKALRLAKENSGAKQAGLVAEYQEATRRLYGDRRFAAATGSTPKKAAPKPANPRQADNAASKKTKVENPKQADKALYKKPSTSYSPAPMKTPAKKSGGVSNSAKVVAGTTAAVALLALTRGKGAGVITSRLAPGLMKNKVARALITGEIKKAAPKVIAKASTKTSTAVMKAKDAAAAARGKSLASKGKEVSQSQYDAMVASAKAKGIKTVSPRSTSTPAKPLPKTSTGRANYGKFGTRDEYLFEKNASVASKAKTAAQQLVNRGNVRWDATAPKPKPTKPKK